MAREAKRGMLDRSRREERLNFAGDDARIAGTGVTANGYAAIIDFIGQDGQRLTALIHEDCYIGWTGGEARSGPLSTFG